MSEARTSLFAASGVVAASSGVVACSFASAGAVSIRRVDGIATFTCFSVLLRAFQRKTELRCH